MNILYIEHYASPDDWGMEHRPFRFARRWIAMGHRVLIIAASFTHLRSRNPEVDGPFCRMEWEGVPFLFVRTPRYEGNGRKRCGNILAFLYGIDRFYEKMTGSFSPDVILVGSTYLLDFYPARRIARRCHSGLIYELHDLWPMSVCQLGGYSPRHPGIRLLQKAENDTLRSCDAVCSMLPGVLPHLQAHGFSGERFFYIPNSVEIPEEKVRPGAYRDTLLSLRRDGFFLVGYTGAMGVANAVWVLIKAARLLRDKPVRFLLIGKGSELESLKQLARTLQVQDQVLFLPPVSHEEIRGLLPLFDGMYIGLQKKPLFRYGISPNKLMDYMAAGKPVVLSVATEENPVEKSGCGLTVEPENPREAAVAIETLRQMTEGQRLEMGRKGQTYIRQHHSEEKLAGEYLRCMQEVCEKKRRTG